MNYSLTLKFYVSVAVVHWFITTPAIAMDINQASPLPTEVAVGFQSHESIISGRILDQQGGAVSGARITVKNSSQFFISDDSGNFRFSVDTQNVALIISSIGYVTQEVAVVPGTPLLIVMEEEQNKLQEVVVIGYGQMKRKDLTGSVGSVNVSDMQKAPVRSIDEALAGRVAGVQVASPDGQPGRNATIVIRGNNSLTQSNSPLFIIDGMPDENADLNSINLQDVESIDVLKDASSTAIYGARGANGVIVITTKQGKLGLPKINYEGYYGYQNSTKQIETMGPYDFVKLQTEINRESAEKVYFDEEAGRGLEYYKNAEGIDWQSKLIKPSETQSHTVNLTAGNEWTKLSLSGSFYDQSGIIVKTGFDRYQGRLNLEQKISEKLKSALFANVSRSKSYGIVSAVANDNTFNSSLFYSIWGYRPVTTGEDILNSLYDPAIDQLRDYRVNPYIEASNVIRDRYVNSISANGFVEYNFYKQFSLKVSGGINYRGSTDNDFNNSMTSSGNLLRAGGTGLGVNGRVFNNGAMMLSNENVVSYRAAINNAHSIDAIVGFSTQSSKSNITGERATHIQNETLGLHGLFTGTPYEVYSGGSQWFLASALGRVNYSYMDKYLFTASFRSDGSSKFAPGNKWSSFPSAAIAWRVSEEGFMQNATIVDDAKLRVSYGITGNNRVSDFPYLSTLTFSKNTNAAYPFNNVVGFGAIIGAVGNPELKWETTRQFDLGVDFSLFKNRLLLNADYYHKTTTDLLLNSPVPYALGTNNIFRNIGKVSNTGFEFTVSTVNIDKPDFKWTSSFNISFNRNKVLALVDEQESMLSNMNWNQGYTSPLYIAKVGQPMGMFYGLIFDGIYQEEDFIKNPNGGYQLLDQFPTNGNERVKMKPGDIRYVDINGDKVVNALDYTAIGNGNPLHVGGFSNNIGYKRFSLNVFLQWSYGNDIYNANRQIFESGHIGNLNQYKTYINRWTPENRSNLLPSATGDRVQYSSRVVEDGSFLRLKTVSLSYDFNPTLLSRLKINTLRIYSSAQNIYTWTNYSGLDPEVAVKYSPLTPGFDYSAYPRNLILTTGAIINF